MAKPTPKLLTKEEAASRKATISTSSEEVESPPKDAFIYTCQNGPNAGCRYYAIKKVDENGNYTSRFVSWVDPPKVDLKTRVAQQEEEIAKLKTKVLSYKRRLSAKKLDKTLEDSIDESSE